MQLSNFLPSFTLVMILISAALLLLLVHGTEHEHFLPKIAIATEGRNNEVAMWLEMMHHMESKNHVTLFLLAYNVPLESQLCSNHSRVICLYGPNSTWTSGRNLLARAISQFEKKNQNHLGSEPYFKYWLFGDQDMVLLDNCGEATHCKPPEYPSESIKLAACCFDIAVKTLLAPEIQYAAVNFVSYMLNQSHVDYLGFSHTDCSDGALNAFHHAAVPVILPYIELFDDQSWWESQRMHFHLITGCFPGYSVYSNVFEVKNTAIHSKYPTGRLPMDEVQQALFQVYGALLLTVLTRSSEQFDQGNCANLDHQQMGLNGTYEPYNHNNHNNPNGAAELFSTYGNSHAWQDLPSFKKCLAALQPRFNRYVETGDLRQIDGWF